jgi:4,5-DOPA dioxygenase extradiol
MTTSAVFVSHGTPMGAIEPSRWTKSWVELGARLPPPRAILSISAHWLTRGGARVTSSERPHMNYDMYGFPEPLYEIQYPAPGSPDLAHEIMEGLSSVVPVYGDPTWGFDHGTWLVLMYLFPGADIPVVQLSVDYGKPPGWHYEVGQKLQFLRERDVLVVCSGNFVHNLGLRNPDEPPVDWAVEFDARMHEAVERGEHQAVIDFQKLGRIASLAHPTYDHFLPVLYFLGLKTEEDRVECFTDGFQWPAVSMRSYKFS